MKPTVAAACIAVSLAACYGAAPPKPPVVPLPPMEEGAELQVHSAQSTDMEEVPHTARTCASDGTCINTEYTTTEPVTHTNTSATYNDQPISYAQFVVMTDPKWDEKLAELDDLAKRCRRANIPRYIGIGLFAAGLAGGIIANAAGAPSAAYGVMYGAAGLGAVSYATGYYGFGGRQCVEARAMFNEMNLAGAMTANTVGGAERAVEMQTLAEQFNAAHRRSARLDMRGR